MDASGARGETRLQGFFVFTAGMVVLLLGFEVLIGRLFHGLLVVAPMAFSAVRMHVAVRITDRSVTAYRLLGGTEELELANAAIAVTPSRFGAPGARIVDKSSKEELVRVSGWRHEPWIVQAARERNVAFIEPGEVAGAPRPAGAPAARGIFIAGVIVFVVLVGITIASASR